MLFRLVFLTMLSLICLPLQAQESTTPLVRAQLISDAETMVAGKSFYVALQLTITPGWHVYWQNPGDSGMATTLALTPHESLSFGEISWPTPTRYRTSGLSNYGYSTQVVLPVMVTPKVDINAATINAKASWLVCRDICIPESAELSLSLPLQDKSAQARIQNALLQVPTNAEVKGALRVDETMVRLEIPRAVFPNAAARELFFYPVTDGIISNDASRDWKVSGDHITLEVARGGGDVVSHFSAVVAHKTTDVIHAKTVQFIQAPVAPTSPPMPWLQLVLFAFLGGLILNAMPCVLPILSLKTLALVKKADVSRREALAHGLAYTLGVLLCFALIATTLLVLKAGGAAIGWGFQLQSPEFVAALSLLMIAVAMNLWGLVEVPTLWRSAGPSQNGVVGTFFTGVLAVLVATPCTAPFMAPALGIALSSAWPLTLMIFAMLGLGLASPYLLVSAWPAARKFLPKPGVWMVTFKQVLGFPMLATAAWLMWVLVRMTDPLALAIFLSAAVTLALCLWWFGRTKNRTSRLVWAALALMIASYGVWKQQPAVVMPHVPFSQEKLAELRSDGQAVFVDVTADWCITCKVNERVALQNDSVRQLMKEKNITLMVADWTKRDAAIAVYLASYARSGVPLYVFYAPGKEGVVLPQILTPALVSREIMAALQN
jgi:thiol:disulfide interchange protein